MSQTSPASADLAQAIDIAVWLERDQVRPLQERLHRDRSIALSLRGARPALLVRQWWARVQPDEAGRGEPLSPGRRLQRLRNLIGWLMLLVGACTGVSVTLSVFRYDGQHPVNVVLVLAILVLMPLALLLLSVLMLPLVPRMTAAGRLLAAIQDAIGVLSPGRYALLIWTRAQATLGSITPGSITSRSENVGGVKKVGDGGPTETRQAGPASESLLRRLGWHAARHGAFTRYARWQMWLWSQQAALGFALGSLCCALALVVFTDLAFGWSTTLDVSVSGLQALVQWLALPWRTLWPQAVPDGALIEASRYFRLGGAAAVEAPPTPLLLAGWWPFVFMCMLTYALLPRLLAWLIGRARLNRCIDALLLEDPRVVALLDRMQQPQVTLSGADAPLDVPPDAPLHPAVGGVPRGAGSRTERRPAAALASTVTGPRETASGHGGRRVSQVLIWNGACPRTAAVELLAGHLGLHCDEVRTIGGTQGYDEDLRIVAAVCESRPATVVVLTKAFEPPLLELLDLLEALRECIGPDVSVRVVPLARQGAVPSTADIGTWRHALERLADPATYLETISA